MRNKTRLPTLTTIIQHSFGSFSHSNQRRKRNKRNPNWKIRSKAVTADDMILYIENPKDATRKLLELINEFGKVARYKLMHRNLLHSFTLMMKYLKVKLRKHSHLPLQQKE